MEDTSKEILEYHENQADSKKPVDEIRICTYNIHEFVHPTTSQLNLEEIYQNLSSMQADIIGMQEVIFFKYNDTKPVDSRNFYWKDGAQLLEILAKRLNMTFIYGASYHKFGNVILTRFPILKQQVQRLHLSRSKSDKEVPRHSRVLVSVTVKLPNEKTLTVHCTHLDHTNEDKRITQWNRIMEHINKEEEHVIIGDFNALRKGDYDAKKMKTIEESRKKGKWELPRTDLVEKIEKSLYLDCLSTYGKVETTCRFGTRVDYMWISHSLANSGNFEIEECKRIDCYGSDHFPLLLTMKLRKQ